jgi:hypothetical protein
MNLLHPNSFDLHQASARRLAAMWDETSQYPAEITALCFISNEILLCTASDGLKCLIITRSDT